MAFIYLFVVVVVFVFVLLLDPVQTHKKTFASTEIGKKIRLRLQPVPLLDAWSPGAPRTQGHQRATDWAWEVGRGRAGGEVAISWERAQLEMWPVEMPAPWLLWCTMNVHCDSDPLHHAASLLCGWPDTISFSSDLLSHWQIPCQPTQVQASGRKVNGQKTRST